MPRENPIEIRRRAMSGLNWVKFGQILNSLGWEPFKITEEKRVYSCGRYTIAMLRFPRNKWKVEMLRDNKIVDMGGFEPENYAKVMAVELALSKSSALFPSEESR